MLSVFFVLNQRLSIKTLKYVLSCYAILYVILLCNLVLTLYKNSPFINAKLFLKIILSKNMLSERLSIFSKKNSFIKKSVEQSKNKECKKRYHKISQLRKFIKYRPLQLYFRILVLALHCYCWDNVKYRLLSKHLLQRKQQHGVWKISKSRQTFRKNIPEYSSKQVAPITYSLEKTFFAAASFEGLWVISIRTR